VSVPYASPSLAAKPPYYINWSFGVQRQISSNMTFGAAYSASVGHFLPRNGDIGIWSNSILPQYLALGSLLGVQATPANIAAAQAVVPGFGLPFSNFQGTIAQALKPFPQYSGVTYYSGDLGNSTYNSLQLTFEHRFAKGFTSQLGYTFSKELDNSIGAATNLGAVGGNRNPFNGRLDKALGAIDRLAYFPRHFRLQPALRQGSRPGQRQRGGAKSGQRLADFRSDYLHVGCPTRHYRFRLQYAGHYLHVYRQLQPLV